MRRLISLPIAVFGSLALASAVLAGGWAEVTVPNVPTDPPAGGETVIDLEVLQHGVTPVSWPTLTVVATDAASGDVFRTAAEPQGPEGHYVATLVFPTAGEWTLTFESAELEMAGTAAVSVVPAAPVAPAVQPGSATFDILPLALVLVALFVVIAGAAVLMRARDGAAAKVMARN